MAATVWVTRGIIISVRGLVFCKLLTDATTTGTTYDTAVQSLSGVQEIAVTFSVSEDIFPADDIPMYEVISMVDSLELSITVAALGRDGEAYLLGRKIDGNGVLLTNQKDSAPYVAVGFESERSDGSIDRIWLYKGKFKPGDLKFRTKEKGKVNWQAPVLTGTFGARISDGELRAVVNDKDSGVDAEIFETFLDEVYQPEGV